MEHQLCCHISVCEHGLPTPLKVIVAGLPNPKFHDITGTKNYRRLKSATFATTSTFSFDSKFRLFAFLNT